MFRPIHGHKPGHPICPVVNWKGAPSYKLARLFTQKIKIMAPLPNTHNLENIRDLIRKLEDTPILPQFALASLDITNLYTNVPIKENREIIGNTLKKNQTNPPAEQELLNWYDTITKQNYFSNKDKILIQQDGLAMGAPTSGIIAEFFLQNLEDTHLTHLSNKHKIVRYFRYVDDIDNLRLQPHKHKQHTERLQHNPPKHKIHSRNRIQQPDQFPRRHHPQNPHQLEDFHIQKTLLH